MKVVYLIYLSALLNAHFDIHRIYSEAEVSFLQDH